MKTYLITRLLLMIVTLFGIICVSFTVIRLTPGDPADLKFDGAGQMASGVNADRGTESAERQYRKRLGLDQPLYVQFGMFLKRLFTGDMISFHTEQNIWKELLPALRVTILLNSIVFVLIYATAVPLGIFSAAYPNSLWDRVSTVILFILYSLPSFWVAEMLRMIFMKPLPIIGRLPIMGLTSLRDTSASPCWEQCQGTMCNTSCCQSPV